MSEIETRDVTGDDAQRALLIMEACHVCGPRTRAIAGRGGGRTKHGGRYLTFQPCVSPVLALDQGGMRTAH
jgi:hypothetical protein